MRNWLIVLSALPLAGCAEQKAKQLAADQLIDPSSAQFREVRSVRSDSGTRVCGEINGKNRMGAYAGFTRFMVNPDTELVQMDQPSARPSSVTALQLAQCERPSYGGYIRDCSFDQERHAESLLAEMFQRDWDRYCNPNAPTNDAGVETNMMADDIDLNLTMDENLSVVQ